MATVSTSLTSYDYSKAQPRMNFHSFDDGLFSRGNRNFFMTQMSPVPSRPNHYLDDSDVLALRRQYDKIDLLGQSRLSNSAEDLSQLDRIPYPFDVFEVDPEDLDEDGIPFDDGAGYDYSIVIQERLKKANEDFKKDETSTEFKEPQRVSFDEKVKAVDIIQDPIEYDQTDLFNQSSMSNGIDDSTSNIDLSANHQYVVPLNDTKPREGPSLLDQIKAIQFHGENQSNRAIEPDENFISSKTPMVVAVNGRFDLKNPDEYVAEKSTTSDEISSENKEKYLFLPRPPSVPKKTQNPVRPSIRVRPKSSDSSKRLTTTPIERTGENHQTKSQTTDRIRPRSATVTTKPMSFLEKSSPGVDFNELLKKAAEKRRLELKEERRRKQEEEEKRQSESIKAKECYERWVAEKDAERRRINREKKLEQEENQTKQKDEEKTLAELRRMKYRQWIERKNNEAILEKEFKKLQANEESASEGSTSSLRSNDHRAFHRWLRRKYQQSLEEKRRLKSEAKRRRRSLKRHRLQLDLQLAKSYGYS